MECRYCQAWNEDDEHRCGRCGRRLHASSARSAPDTYPISTATAPSLISLHHSVVKDAGPVPETEAEPVNARVSYQRSLFQEMKRVVQMPATTSGDAPRATRSVRSTRSRRAPEGQGRFDFNNEVDTQVEAVIYCDAPVALPIHRIIATALDTSMILIALGVFVVTFSVAGGEIALNRHTIPFFGSIAAVFALFYHFLFCISGGDTAGMRWAQLRLVNFDGQEPDREQRVYRLIGSCLSLLAAGLGLIWALVDEESLTWHDHISKTFPSPQPRG